jgi:hypothetical protein
MRSLAGWLGAVMLAGTAVLGGVVAKPVGPGIQDSDFCEVDVEAHESECTFHCHKSVLPFGEHLLYILASGPAEVVAELYCGRLLTCVGEHSCQEQTVSAYDATGTCRLFSGSAARCGDWDVSQ